MARLSSPYAGSTVRNTRKPGAACTKRDEPSTRPHSLTSSEPPGSMTGFNRSSTVASQKFALSSSSQCPASMASTSGPSTHVNAPRCRLRLWHTRCCASPVCWLAVATFTATNSRLEARTCAFSSATRAASPGTAAGGSALARRCSDANNGAWALARAHPVASSSESPHSVAAALSPSTRSHSAIHSVWTAPARVATAGGMAVLSSLPLGAASAAWDAAHTTSRTSASNCSPARPTSACSKQPMSSVESVDGDSATSRSGHPVMAARRRTTCVLPVAAPPTSRQGHAAATACATAASGRSSAVGSGGMAEDCTNRASAGVVAVCRGRRMLSSTTCSGVNLSAGTGGRHNGTPPNTAWNRFATAPRSSAVRRRHPNKIHAA